MAMELQRLPDEFYTESELYDWYHWVLSGPSKLDYSDKQLAIFALGNSNKVLILPVPSELGLSEVQIASRALWSGMELTLKYVSNILPEHQYSSILNVLSEYKYQPTKQLPCTEYLFTWQPWFNQLIKDPNDFK